MFKLVPYRNDGLLDFRGHGAEVKLVVILAKDARLCCHTFDMATVYQDYVVLKD